MTLASAEVACLVRRQGSGASWHMWWAVTPSSPADLDALRAKIGPKMTVVSILAGFATAILGGVLVQLPHEHPASRWIALGAVALYATAATVLVCALLANDQLTMPSRFWPAKRARDAPQRAGAFPVARPPSSAVRLLHQHTVRLWRSVVAALLIAASGTVVLVVAAYWPLGEPWQWTVVGATAAIPAAVAIWWWRRFRPHLGSED
jgi:hypothetical protein